MVLMMMDYQLISDPVLYPSFYFMKYRSEYYDRLDAVRKNGDYEGWTKYYLRGIRACADDIVKRAWAIDGLLEQCSNDIEKKLSRVRKNANILLDQLCHTPVIAINDVAKLIGASYVTAQKLVASFVELGILQKENGNQRNKTYSFRKYLEILEQEFTG
jgi:Fic family protein